MRSSIVAIVVFVLGLSATVYSADNECTTKCDVKSNGTAEWNNGVQIQYGVDVTITVSKAESVIVIVNQKTKVVIAFDLKASLIFIYHLDASFGIVIDLNTGGCVKVQLDIKLVVAGDFSELREVLDKAKEEIKAAGSTVIIVSFTFIQQASFDINAVFIGGSATVIAEIRTTYSFFFEISFDAVVVIGRDVNFAGAVVVGVFGTATEITVAFAQSISVVISSQVQLTFSFGIFLVDSIRQGSVDIFLSFKASFQAVKGKLEEAIEEAKKGVHIDKSFNVGSFKFRFVVVLVKEYLEFALTLGKIKIDIGYSGKTLAVFNNRANIVFVINGDYTFVYSYELEAGFLFYGSNVVYVSSTVIQTKIGEKTEINSGTLALYINENAKTVFQSSTKITIKDFKAALDSKDKCDSFAKSHGIAHSDIFYKVFVSYSGSLTAGLLGLSGYSLDVTIALRVTFSINASYEIETTYYSNAIVIAFAAALKVVTTLVSSATLFASIKIVLGA